MIQNLFPIPVGFYKLDDSFTPEELNFLTNQDTYVNVGNLSSLNTKILDDIKLKRIREFIEKTVSTYFQSVWMPKTEINLRITQSWVNYTTKNQFHHKHSHPNSFISGVFYIQAKKETDKIYFHKNNYQQLKVQTKEWNLWNSESWWFEVETNDLVLFPSGLDHLVETVEHEDTRISLAFNTFPVGLLGEEFEMTKLEIK